MDRLLAGRAATTLIFLRTGRTLDEQQMTTLIPAIGMHICRLPTLMTVRDDLSADALTHPVVKYKILPPELILQSLFPHRIGVVDDAPFQVEYISETLVQQIGTGL